MEHTCIQEMPSSWFTFGLCGFAGLYLIYVFGRGVYMKVGGLGGLGARAREMAVRLFRVRLTGDLVG